MDFPVSFFFCLSQFELDFCAFEPQRGLLSAKCLRLQFILRCKWLTAKDCCNFLLKEVLIEESKEGTRPIRVGEGCVEYEAGGTDHA